MRRGIRRTAHRSRWIQVNCALFPQAADGQPYVPWQALSTTLERWRGEGRFRLCFFTRKPPGLRLRFYGDDLAYSLDAELITWLEEAERQSAIRGFRFAIYDPETFRFGGLAGMAIAHEHFDRDSHLALRYESLSDVDRGTLSRQSLSLAVSNDLFGRCTGDAAELWDIWKRLERATDSLVPSDAGSLEDTRAAALSGPDFLDSLPAASAALIHEARVANLRIAARLRAAEAAGKLEIGPRAWLAAATIFHWNRLGLTLAELPSMVGAMLRVLDPDPP